MSDGTVPLHRYPNATVRLACRNCSRKGQFRKAALIERVGPDESLVMLRLKIAEGWGCDRAADILAGRHRPIYEWCGVGYPDLIPAESAREFFKE